jgi:hypothetical protein
MIREKKEQEQEQEQEREREYRIEQSAKNLIEAILLMIFEPFLRNFKTFEKTTTESVSFTF